MGVFCLWSSFLRRCALWTWQTRPGAWPVGKDQRCPLDGHAGRSANNAFMLRGLNYRRPDRRPTWRIAGLDPSTNTCRAHRFLTEHFGPMEAFLWATATS